MVLFSKELFSNTRLSQLSTPGVQLHIEDSRAGVQRSSRQKKLLKIPNEPNFQKSRLSVTLAMIRTYNETCPNTHKKSEPNPNPIRTRSEPNPNPIQTRSKPNQTQFQNKNKIFPPTLYVVYYLISPNPHISVNLDVKLGLPGNPLSILKSPFLKNLTQLSSHKQLNKTKIFFKVLPQPRTISVLQVNIMPHKGIEETQHVVVEQKQRNFCRSCENLRYKA